MARKVYTYNSITQLRSCSWYGEICKYPHIVVTSGLYHAVAKHYGSEITDIIDIHRIQNELAKGWNENSSAIEQYVSLGNVIRTMSGMNGNEQVVQQAMLKSRRDVLNSIRALVEAEVYPEDLAVNTIDERLFKAVWQKFEEVNLCTARFRASMDCYASDLNGFIKELCQLHPCLQSDTIVLHGFYYITPIQERIIDLLELAGKNMIFIGNIGQGIDAVNEVWYKEFSKENKFSDMGDWTISEVETMPPAEFGKVFEGKVNPVILSNIRIIQYKNEAEFIADSRRMVKDGIGLYSNDVKKTETALRTVFPDKFKKKHLLSYPVGQYFYVLHSMWDSNLESLTLTVDNMQICFASGWVVNNGKNGRDYSDELELIKPYFEGCVTVDQWRERILEYKECHTNLTECFEGHIKKDKPENVRYHRIMANPFLNLSCFSLNREDADIVFDLIETLIDTAIGLFGNGSEIDLGKHFSKIQELLSNGSEESAVYDEEKAILQELSERIARPHNFIDRCLPDDISNAVMMIIGGGILDEDNYEFYTSSDEVFIRDLSQVETASIISNGKIHICLCDEHRLPGVSKKYSWPLNEELLKNTLATITTRRRQYLMDMINITENAPLSKRYLFYCALQNKQVELSWIVDENGKKVSESPYLKLLEEMFGCKVEPYDKFHSYDTSKAFKPRALPSIKLKPADMPVREMKYDMMLCQYKYIYGYMAGSIPSYRSTFHYNFVLTAIISALSKASGCPKEIVAKNVLDNFSYLSPVEKRQIRDFVTNTPSDAGGDSMDDVSYSGLRFSPHIINKMLISTAKASLDANEGKPVTANLIYFDNPDYYTCLYCQFRDICIHATREVEKE